MPQIKVEHVVSFSSEDPSYPVNNLLSKDIVNKRWVGQEKGEASVSVILQLEKSTQITSIHVGSYHSALIEVLVGRSEASNQAFEVLLCASTFMTPADSRNSVNISKVRMFTTDQLVASVQSKNWDRVRVVCTQPFNRHVQYGLSFIQLFSSDTQPVAAETKVSSLSTKTISLGRFKLRDLSSDEEDSGGSYKPGELFAMAKRSPSLSTDAQIRKAATSTNSNSSEESNLLVKTVRTPNPNKPSTSKKCKTSENEDVLSRGRDQLMYDDEDDNPSAKIDRIIKRDRDVKNELNKQKALELIAQSKNEPKNVVSKFDFRKKFPKKNDSSDSESKAKDNEKTLVKLNYTLTTDDSKRKDKGVKILNNNDKRKLPIDDVGKPSVKNPRRDNKKTNPGNPSPFDNIIWGPQCLRGVVFVLSGYVNPKRSTLRDMAMSLGARYCPDWGPTCTHLVCAFANTPKHLQVRNAGGDAAIVNSDWIEECAAKEAHLPWQWFALDRNKKIDRPTGPLKKPEAKKIDVEVPTTSALRDDSDNDENMEPKMNAADISDSHSEEDTDDEIEKVMKRNDEIEMARNDSKPTAKRNVDQLSDDSLTDVEDAVGKKENHNKHNNEELCIYDRETDQESPPEFVV